MIGSAIRNPGSFVMAEIPFPLEGRRVWVAGHRGLVGSAVARRLARAGATVLGVPRADLDLRRPAEVEGWLDANRPDAIVLAAGTVGGILANDSRPAEFLHDNLAIADAVIHGAWRTGVRRLLFLGSSCIYPRLAPQPMAEDALLTGPLEPTNQWYAIAKIAGIRLCQAYRRQYGCDFVAAMPTNLYGPGDNFDPAASHVLPAIIRKVHAAKAEGRETVEVWGTGAALREFLHVDDLADALVFLLRRYSAENHINVGSGAEVSIADLYRLVAAVVGWEGRLVFDTDRPDGMPRKLMDGSRLAALGWRPTIALEDGLRQTYAWFLEHGIREGRGIGARA
jgi:GDP-L-fucose synthase